MKASLFIFVSLLLLTAAGKAQTRPASPYSPFREYNGVIYVSGQLGVNKSTTDTAFSTEVNQVFRNIDTILAKAGSSLPAVVNVTVYLKDIATYEAFNRIYTQTFQAPFPARSCVAVSALAAGARLEVAVIAVKKN